jgi:hypothetical protein
MSIPTNKIINRQEILKKDEAFQRNILIKLQEQHRPIARALWNEHQSRLYPDLLNISNEPTVANLLQNSMESLNSEDSLQIQVLAQANLLTITDGQTASYILDRLNGQEKSSINESFPSIVALIRDNYLKMSKKTFLRLICEKTFESADEKWKKHIQNPHIPHP